MKGASSSPARADSMGVEMTSFRIDDAAESEDPILPEQHVMVDIEAPAPPTTEWDGDDDEYDGCLLDVFTAITGTIAGCANSMQSSWFDCGMYLRGVLGLSTPTLDPFTKGGLLKPFPLSSSSCSALSTPPMPPGLRVAVSHSMRRCMLLLLLLLLVLVLVLLLTLMTMVIMMNITMIIMTITMIIMSMTTAF